MSLKHKIQTAIKETGYQIPIAVFLSLLVGLTLDLTETKLPEELVQILQLPGDMWIRSLKSIVIPLMLCSMIGSMQDLKKIPGGGSKVAKYALGYYLFSTLFALAQATLFIHLILVPNVQKNTQSMTDINDDNTPKEVVSQTIAQRTTGLLLDIIPNNVFGVMANSDLVAVLVLGIVMGVLIQDTKDKPSFVVRIVKEIENIVYKVVSFLVFVSPIGIFFLILSSLAGNSIGSILGKISWYLVTLFVAWLFQLFVFHPVCYLIALRKNPFSFMIKFIPTAFTAFGTGSSAACIPVAMECSHKAGIKPEIYKFLVPLGVSLNMNGSAILFPTAVSFMFLSVGKTLTIADSLILMFTGFLATAGASPIPQCGLVFYIMMMNAVGLKMNPTYYILASIDWLTERPECMMNMLGDTVGAAIAQKYGLGIEVDPSVNERPYASESKEKD